MASRPPLGNVGLAPRLLTREQAAAYCGVSVQTFTSWVRGGIVPGPLPGTRRWDKRAIDATLDLVSRIGPNLEPNALDEWKAVHHARHLERNPSR